MADSQFDDLERLAKMLDEGKVTPEEYEQVKAELLREITQGQAEPEKKLPPPGWYKDESRPDTHQGYWDGEKWTGQTRPIPTPPASAAAPNTPPASAAAPTTPLITDKAKSKNGGIGCLAVIGIAVVIYLVSQCGGGSGGGNTPANTNGDEVGAYVVCQEFVEDRLKAPGTANFGGPYSQVTQSLGGGRYRVETYVDAQNSFGAELRTDFICVVDHQSGDTYRLESLVMDE